jgi:hypothetical protein
MTIQIELVGMDKLVRLLATAGSQASATLGRALHDEALDIFAKSQKLVPHDTGVLMASGMVHPPSIVGGDIYVEISYGGNASSYAGYQHETDGLAHDPGRQSHYLQQPFEEAVSSGYDDRLRQRVEALLGGLV